MKSPYYCPGKRLMKALALLASVLMVSGCEALKNLAAQVQSQSQAAKVDLALPFIGVDQDNPVAYQFVSHSASAKVTVNDTRVEPVEQYEWGLLDSAGGAVPLNSLGDRMEWLPTKPGRYTVAVKMSYQGKGVTQTRDVTIGDASPSITAFSRGDVVTLTWPKGPARVPHTWEVSYTLDGGAEQALTLADPDAGIQGHAIGNYEKLAYVLRLMGKSGKEYFTGSADAVPATAEFEIWGDGERLLVDSCNGWNWLFKGLGTPPRRPAYSEFRNSGRLPIAYLFRAFRPNVLYLPGEDGPDPESSGFPPLSGILTPGQKIEITRFFARNMYGGLVGSVRPFSEPGGGKGDGVVDWQGQLGTYQTSRLYVARVWTENSCRDLPDERYLAWK